MIAHQCHLQCGCSHTPQETYDLAVAILADGQIKGFLREAARTTVNQLQRAIEAGEAEKAGELAKWLREEAWI